jgi:adenylate kinase
MLKEAIAKGTDLGRRVEGIMARGELVTDEIVIGLIETKMTEGAQGGFIFDGFPRTLKQADALGELMSRMGSTLDRVVEMQVDDTALVDRVTGRYTCGNCGAVYHDTTHPTKVAGTCDVCGSANLKRRADDNAETLKTRLMEYYKKTSPLIGYYYAKGLLSSVDGLADMDSVSSAIASALD